MQTRKYAYHSNDPNFPGSIELQMKQYPDARWFPEPTDNGNGGNVLGVCPNGDQIHEYEGVLVTVQDAKRKPFDPDLLSTEMSRVARARAMKGRHRETFEDRQRTRDAIEWRKQVIAKYGDLNRYMRIVKPSGLGQKPDRLSPSQAAAKAKDLEQVPVPKVLNRPDFERMQRESPNRHLHMTERGMKKFEETGVMPEHPQVDLGDTDHMRASGLSDVSKRITGEHNDE
jgi:hypothetical protein